MYVTGITGLQCRSLSVGLFWIKEDEDPPPAGGEDPFILVLICVYEGG